MVIFRASAGI